MSSVDNLIVVAPQLFSYLNQFKDYIHILSTSKSNPIKKALLHYFKTSKHWECRFDTFGSSELFYYLQFFHSVRYITLNQYQRSHSPTEVNNESTMDLTDFLDLFYTKFPQMSQQLNIIRLMSIQYDDEHKQHYYFGKITPIDAYTNCNLIDSNNNDQVTNLKFPNLKVFASYGNWHNEISPKHIEYISSESNDINVIDIANMVPMKHPPFILRLQRLPPVHHEFTVFKQLFSEHHNLTFIRVRISQNFEGSRTPSICTADFEDAHLDKLKILMIQNSVAFQWDSAFIDLLKGKLNSDIFTFLYLTMSGERIPFFGSQALWKSFQKKFKKAFVQRQKLRDRWYLLRKLL